MAFTCKPETRERLWQQHLERMKERSIDLVRRLEVIAAEKPDSIYPELLAEQRAKVLSDYGITV